MANQIKKKFIGQGQVGSEQILIEKDLALKGTLQNGSEVEVLKLGLNDEVLVKGQEVATKAMVDTEKARIDAILSASEADKDSFAEIVSLINSIDTTNDNAFAAYVLSNDAAVALKADTTYVDAQDAATLASANSYTDAQIAAIPPVDISGKADITYVDAQDALKVSKSGDTMSGSLIVTDGVASVTIKHDESTIILDGGANGGGTTTIYQGQMDFANTNGATVVSSYFAGSSAKIENTNTSNGNVKKLMMNVDSLEVSNDVSGYGLMKSSLTPTGLNIVDPDGAQFDVQIGSHAKLFASAGVALLPTVDAGIVVKKYSDDQDAATLVSAQSYADAAVLVEKNRAEAAEGVLAGRLDVVEPKVTTLEGEMDAAQADIVALDGRVDALEAALAPVWAAPVKFDLTATDLSNGYVELAHEAVAYSIHASVDRLQIHEGEDFTVSVVAGKTRLTFAGELVAPGNQVLTDADNIYVKYQILA